MTPVEPAHFSSDYSAHLYGFVESKRRSGYKYNGEVKELQRFDRFLSANGQTPTDNSRDVIYGWLKGITKAIKLFLPGTAFIGSFTGICLQKVNH